MKKIVLTSASVPASVPASTHAPAVPDPDPDPARNIKRKALPLRYRWMYATVPVVPAVAHVSEPVLDQVASPVHMSVVPVTVSDVAVCDSVLTPAPAPVHAPVPAPVPAPAPASVPASVPAPVHVSGDIVAVPVPDSGDFKIYTSKYCVDAIQLYNKMENRT
eukprot:TRINITY_DN123_c4_g1_i1.p1 TRINITY_DN123_c4_g1~~TRINITY_DN123_c4_g1_i1.p1  ORF type:complete len:162 (+),score=39.22 TRINITY_DN123_c4_g1_i1:243-728(+)